MACDICTKNTGQLCDLRDIYQTADIKQVCTDCTKEINKKLDQIRVMTGNMQVSLLQRFMRFMKGGE